MLVAIGLIGFLGTYRLNESSTAMRRVSEIDAAVGEINRKVTELQLRVSRYMATGHDSLRSDIIQLNDSLIDEINKRATNQIDPEMLDLFVRMSERLPEFRAHFSSVIEERGLRADLVQKQLPAQAEVIQEQLKKIAARQLTTEQPAASDSDIALLCKSRFLEAERLLLRYYVTADASFVNDALEEISLAIDSLDPLEQQIETRPLRLQMIQELQEYRRLGVRAVQATRSYLYLVNVVMAGEASEVTYFSHRLRSLSQSRRDQISQAMAVTTTNVKRVTGIGICIAVALGIFIASRLGALILKPVTTLTETFRQLAGGQTVVAIPETERRDEIGEMALAAEVFRQRNVEQRQLLEKAESLATELAVKAGELQATNAELDSFAYVASHDLKSPLRGIRQLAAWIEEDAGHLLPEESVKHFQAMQSRVQRMENLLEDLLNFSRIGRGESHSEVVNMNDLMTGIIEMTDNPDQVRVSVPKPLPTLKTVRTPLEQVFLNLIGNAIKYNDKQDKGLIEILWEQEADTYLFHIRDNGPGIEPQHHERVFQLYQRVGHTDVDGSGMGLAIVKKQVESQLGSIHLDSNPDGGVTFTVAWPATLA